MISEMSKHLRLLTLHQSKKRQTTESKKKKGKNDKRNKATVQITTRELDNAETPCSCRFLKLTISAHGINDLSFPS